MSRSESAGGLGSLVAADERHLRRALRLAARGRYRVAPNPQVGAVLVQDGKVVGEGFHRRFGGPHAEIEALRSSSQEMARGATLYVNLEPCSHHGKTPPCVERVIAAGIARVVCCHRDPNPQVAGDGLKRLGEAGVKVAMGGPVAEAVELNLRFLIHHLGRRPQVTLKWAMSLDGKIATASGESQWISSPQGRRWALDLRELHGAILVGIETALADDPRLNRRLAKAEGEIVRVILDRRLRLDTASRMLSEPGDVLVYTEQRGGGAAAGLRGRGATVVPLACVEPSAVLDDLHRRGVDSVLVEGGGRILEAFVRSSLYDRIAVCCAPRLLGGTVAPGPIPGSGFGLEEGPRLERLRCKKRGPDLILEGLRAGCLQDLLARLDG